ncbi:hypothetical protein EIK77_007487 [Talaromyces pinophilus]|nr:hypothetical protein EIK77_007487 [Talaromyces pinophilus]PCH05680.1 Glucose/ribitol dehydrogenase [Penicillium occitanis (nom. inval.)]PCH06378.1 hypothetical protein PENOC_024150 [Penicillium occitanis (nom. inval.)]
MPSISGQTLLVIGGTSGIGFGVAKLALSEGMRVAIASSNPERVAKAVERLKESSPDGTTMVHGYTVDLSQPDMESRLQKLLIDVTATFGGDDSPELLDHLVFTAGGPIEHRPTSDIDLEFIHKCGQVRFAAPLLIGKLASQFFKPHWKSSITFTSGKVAEKPLPLYTVFAAYAAGLSGATRNLALDLKPIRVNQVNPGAVITELWGKEAEDRIEAAARKALLGKLGTPEETAEAYIYLMRDTTATGVFINNSGGELLL